VLKDIIQNEKTKLTGSAQSKMLSRKRRVKQNIPLFIMLIPPLIFFILFKYVPMGGLVIAFKNYRLMDGIWGSAWVGFRNFELLFNNPSMFKIIKNTFVLSMLNVFVGFPFPIILALFLNEVRVRWYRKSVQTLVYLPHFLNWVIIGGIIITLFATGHGTINTILSRLGIEKYPFLYKNFSWITIYLVSGIWKGAGWGSIIYLASMSSINPELYEAARMDGATRVRQAWSITIPSIFPTMMVLLIMRVENIMEVGFDHIYVLTNAVVSDISEVISVFSYRMAIAGTQYSIATAMGLFESLVGLVLVVIVNRIARQFNTSLW
jgi:putative aldouronate transport system permease protein